MRSRSLSNFISPYYQRFGFIETREAFAAKYGEALWDKDIAQFHQITKIEPLQRGKTECGIHV
jgi:hypothetical protein